MYVCRRAPYGPKLRLSVLWQLSPRLQDMLGDYRDKYFNPARLHSHGWSRCVSIVADMRRVHEDWSIRGCKWRCTAKSHLQALPHSLCRLQCLWNPWCSVHFLRFDLLFTGNLRWLYEVWRPWSWDKCKLPHLLRCFKLCNVQTVHLNEQIDSNISLKILV